MLRCDFRTGHVPRIGSIAQSSRVYEIRALGAISRMLPPSLALSMKPRFGDTKLDGWIHPLETSNRGIVVEVYWRVDFTGDPMIQAVRQLIEGQYKVLGVLLVVNGEPGHGIERLARALSGLDIPLSAVPWLPRQGPGALRAPLTALLRRAGLPSELRAPQADRLAK